MPRGRHTLRELLSRFIAVERNHRGLTQRQFGERVGIDQGDISKLEAGIKPGVKLSTLDRLFSGLGLDIPTALRMMAKLYEQMETEPEPPGVQLKGSRTTVIPPDDVPMPDDLDDEDDKKGASRSRGHGRSGVRKRRA